MNIKFILSRLSVCAIAVALSIGIAGCDDLFRDREADEALRDKKQIKGITFFSGSEHSEHIKKFTKDDIVEPAQEEKAKPTFEEIVKAAGNGNADMQLEQGWRYFNGAGTATNFVKAAECFHKAAEQGNREAQFNIGSMYAEGIGVEKNWAEAAAWFTKAAAQGHGTAKANLCVMYAEGIGVEKNPAEAETYLNDAVFVGREPEVTIPNANISNDELIWRFRSFRNNGLFEHPISKQWIYKLAERGHVEAAVHLGDDCYKYYNWKDAVKWYRVAAENKTSRIGSGKYVHLLSRIGFIYDKGGYGVEEDNAEAIKWYSKAVGIDAVGINASAALRLANMYFDGEGVNKDPRMAVNLLYQILSKYEDRNVCRRLAHCYIDGEGVPENMFMAAIWWLKAERLNWILVFAGLTGVIAIGSIMIVSFCFAIICIKKIFS